MLRNNWNDTITVTNVNEAPAAILLANDTVSENVPGAVVGNVTVTDPDIGDTHTFTVNDARFEIVNAQLKLKAGQALDFEATPSLSVIVTATDVGGLLKSQGFTILVNDRNDAPTRGPRSARQLLRGRPRSERGFAPDPAALRLRTTTRRATAR